MYADRVDDGTRRSIKERLNGNAGNDSVRRRQIASKRQRPEDDKWEHDLYNYDVAQVSNHGIGARDLRLKLQKKNIEQMTQSMRGSLLGGTRDLREKLSGTTYLQPTKIGQPRPKAKPKPAVERGKPAKRNALVQALVSETKRVAGADSKKKTQQKAESVDSFLNSLGLEKYSITFQAEEIDMAALVHMTDADLKALGIPMGPRKKILLELESKV